MSDIQRGEVGALFRHNYLAHSIEGGLYMGGLAFIAAETVMPSIIKSLGAPIWLISLTPSMLLLGVGWPSLLIAHRVEQMSRVKPYILATGLLQRLPFLLAALSLLFFVDTQPRITLLMVALAPFFSGLIMGLNYAAWMHMIARIIPENRLASSWAIRWTISALIGIFAGGIVKTILNLYPGPMGYGILHLIAFVFFMASYSLQARLSEIPQVPQPTTHRVGLRDNLKNIPKLLANDARFRTFLLMRMFATGSYITIPFLGIHTLSLLGKQEEYLGILVLFQMTGGILGNVVAGFLGDNYGAKLPLIIARIAMIATCLGAAINHFDWGFSLIFLLLGLAICADQVAIATLSIEVCPVERRPTYISLLASLTSPSMLAAAVISTLIRQATGQLLPAALLSTISVVFSLILLMRIHVLRQNGVLSIGRVGYR